jgi:hypothetical protein
MDHRAWSVKMSENWEPLVGLRSGKRAAQVRLTREIVRLSPNQKKASDLRVENGRVRSINDPVRTRPERKFKLKL